MCPKKTHTKYDICKNICFFFKVAGKSCAISEGAGAFEQEYLAGEYETSICQERKDDLMVNSKLDSDYKIAKVCGKHQNPSY